MALKLNEAYPGRFNNPSPEYPQGSFKNRTTPTAEDGSYFEQQWANDHLAFLSSLLDGAGAEADGLVDQVGSSQYYNALLQVIQDQNSIPISLLTSGISGSFSNLKASATGTSATVTVTADSICLKNSANEQVVVNGVSVTPSLAVSGVNGLDSGTSAINTWYSVWVIWNGSAVSGLLSTSPTNPVLPAGYTHKARVGWVRSDSNASNKYPLKFVQRGDLVEYKLATGTNLAAYPLLASGSNGLTLVAVSVSNSAPPTASAMRIIAGQAGGSVGSVYLSANAGITAGPESTFVGRGNTNSQYSGNNYCEILLETNNIYYLSDMASGFARAVGWRDNL